MMTFEGILMAGVMVASFAMIMLTPSQVHSRYWVVEGFEDGWLLVQEFYVFGARWRKSWCVDVARGCWVDASSRKPVSSSRSEWLTNLTSKWQAAHYAA